ncbi:MAG: FtsQ-type POTRA domain-containing protein [Acidimicrobiales bacterium]
MSARTLQRPASDAIDPRIAARREQVERDRGRRRRRRLVVALTLVGMLATAGFVSRTALADVDTVRIEAGQHVTEQQVLEASGVRPGDQLVDLDASAIRDRLLTLPWVRDASVRIDWSGTVTLRIVERQPLAAVADPAAGWLLVDTEGRVLGPLSEPGWLVLEGVQPAPVGERLGGPVEPALAVAGSLSPGVRSRVSAVVVSPDGGIRLRLVPSGEVVFGPATAVEEKVLALRTVFAQVDDRCLATIDVRLSDRPVITRDGGCEKAGGGG